jgi:hypothetical protein
VGLTIYIYSQPVGLRFSTIFLKKLFMVRGKNINAYIWANYETVRIGPQRQKKIDHRDTQKNKLLFGGGVMLAN